MVDKKRNKLSIIAKPTHDCNLACSYCYMDPNAEKGTMDGNTLENMVRKSMEIHKKVSFVWHGGEPLLMPLDFYRRAVEIQREYPNTQAQNGFQSNGTLVTDDVLDFCQAYDFDIGFSLDGPQQLNDLTRTDGDGKSVFKKVLEASKKAKARKLGGGVIVVLSKLNINRLDDIYDFARSEGINLKLNPLIKSGRALCRYQDIGIGPAEYGQRMVELFDRWFEDGSDVHLDPFEELLGNMLTGIPWGCNYSETCQRSFISVGPTGSIYPCGRFDGVEGFYLGDINSDDLATVLDSETRRHLATRAERIEECKPCDYRQICNSGCMHNAYMAGGRIDSRDYYCASYRLLFSHIEKKLTDELKKAEVDPNDVRTRC
jgi:uncharacterized protein